MSGLLQRLAGQALGAKTANPAPRIRAAASVHAQAPVTPLVSEGAPCPSLSLPTPSESPYSPRFSGPQEKPDEREIAAAAQSRAVLLESRASHPDIEQPAAPTRHNEIAPLIAPPAQSKSTEMAARLPERLLGEATPAAPRANDITPTHAPSLAASQTRAAEHGPTEVHVHIGRIEVTAIHEASGLPKQRRAPRATRPLSDYLARRSSP